MARQRFTQQRQPYPTNGSGARVRPTDGGSPFGEQVARQRFTQQQRPRSTIRWRQRFGEPAPEWRDGGSVGGCDVRRV
ncbi:hypothetical protein [Actinophytocola sp.]|uniref:hypothetical protein n=1 Tax=Actinophytocola sp. TaxID=1872138 RepID=UPI00389ADEB7